MRFGKAVKFCAQKGARWCKILQGVRGLTPAVKEKIFFSVGIGRIGSELVEIGRNGEMWKEVRRELAGARLRFRFTGRPLLKCMHILILFIASRGFGHGPSKAGAGRHRVGWFGFKAPSGPLGPRGRAALLRPAQGFLTLNPLSFYRQYRPKAQKLQCLRAF